MIAIKAVTPNVKCVLRHMSYMKKSRMVNNITVEVKAVSRVYQARKVVNALSLKLEQGKILGLLGANGAGKTTTMKMMAGHLMPTAGAIYICGIDITQTPTEAKALIGYLPEHRPLYKELTVDEYLEIAARFHKLSSHRIKQSIAYVKECCGLTDVGKRVIEQLSNGYQQRVGIAQAIIHAPMVVILDEPTVGLDPIQIRQVRSLMREIAQDASVIFSTHLLPEVEMICDDVHILDQGHTVYQADIRTLQHHMQTRSLVAAFKRPTNLQALYQLPNVLGMHHQNEHTVVIQYQHASPAEALVTMAVQQDWGLYLLNEQQSTLEDVFIQLAQPS
jgi:ABC-2 type transport system ATP-binding protein